MDVDEEHAETEQQQQQRGTVDVARPAAGHQRRRHPTTTGHRSVTQTVMAAGRYSEAEESQVVM